MNGRYTLDVYVDEATDPDGAFVGLAIAGNDPAPNWRGARRMPHSVTPKPKASTHAASTISRPRPQTP